MRWSSCLVVRWRGGVVGDLLGEGDGRPGAAAGAHGAAAPRQAHFGGGGVGIGWRGGGGRQVRRRRLRGDSAGGVRLAWPQFD